MPCPEVVVISYIRLAKVLTLFSVEGDAQVEQKYHKHGFLTILMSMHYGNRVICPRIKCEL